MSHNGPYRAVTTQTVGVSSRSAATTNAVADQIQEVRLVSTTNCHYVIGSAPTATTGDPFLPAGTIEYIRIGINEKVAFIQRAGTGDAYVTELSK